MPRLAFVDGQIVPLARAGVSVEDRGLQFADSVYEVCAVMNGQLFDWPQHLARLARNLGELQIAMPMTPAALTQVARRLLAANRAREALLYIQVTRGTARREHVFPGDRPPTMVMTVRPFDFAQRLPQQRVGVAAITVSDQRWLRCDIKTTGLLPNVLAKQAARAAGAFEALFVGDDGMIREGGSTNVWAVIDGRLRTPPLSPRLLPGIMRSTAMQVAEQAQLAVDERSFGVAEAHAADELFLTSTTAPVVPIVRLDRATIGDGRPGPVAGRLAALVWQEIAAQTGYVPAG